jgi:hypothetical protein
MKVSGFTIIRNALKFDYPILESINSILPICDEFIVSVGNSEDQTLDLIKSINSPKIKIIESVWDDQLRKGGKILAVETQKAKSNISPDSTWAFYLQADEVVHEKYLDNIVQSMQKWKYHQRVEGLVFDYTHFYGSYDYIGDSRSWYRKEVRIVRNSPDIYSFRDAQGFQKNGRPLYVKPAHAQVYHYGWVKPPAMQQAKQLSFNKMWHDNEWIEKNVPKVEEFDYSFIDSLAFFKEDHPQVILPRIKAMNWKFSFDPVTEKKFSIKKKFLYYIEKLTGWRIGEYKNYRII